MRLKSGLATVMATFLLSGCDLYEGNEVVGMTVKSYEITGITAPRYSRKRHRSFRVSIRDVDTGKDLGRHFVARRCRGWSRLENGSRWSFPETTFRRHNGTTYTEVDVSSLCERLG